ncbi:helix-turn-helix domain-containing protein [Shimazuella sp. AN120528]|uniref:helix-turn-helix domain-containing protein n=1 Tax=Shimazuella soli TaxID=1892854 RepID=UPI001F0F52C7|nr:helix-turn-helix domain-containing protein [Shimazuella soli]MCH5586029.1 helix-turn-helix domain-containing protein [Shimazuella soli]
MCDSLNTNVEYHKLSKSFSNFNNTESLNTAIRQHLYNKSHLLTPSSITVYKLLARYAVKYRGCAFLKIDSIAELTKLSRSTIIRALNLLHKLDIVLKRHVMRPIRGGNGANIYVLQRYVPEEKPVDNTSATPSVQPREMSENVEVPSNLTEDFGTEAIISEIQEIKKINKRFVSVYDRFRSVVFTYVKDKKLLYRLYGVYLAQTKYLKLVYEEQELIDIAIYALRASFNRTKKKNIRNLAGYFNGVLSNCLDKLYYESTAEYVC